MTRFTCVSERLSYGISADAHALLGVNTESVVDGKGLFQFWVMSTWRMAAVRSNCIRRSKVHWFLRRFSGLQGTSLHTLQRLVFDTMTARNTASS